MSEKSPAMPSHAPAPESCAAASAAASGLREVTVTAKVLERFELAYGEYLAEIERFCSSKQVPYIQADISVPFEELILRVFRRGGFLR